jgi:excisionase family DNA binding protein
MDTHEQLYTVAEVARFLRVADKTVRTMIKERELAAFKIRDEWRIRASELARLMMEDTQPMPSMGPITEELPRRNLLEGTPGRGQSEVWKPEP